MITATATAWLADGTIWCRSYNIANVVQHGRKVVVENHPPPQIPTPTLLSVGAAHQSRTNTLGGVQGHILRCKRTRSELNPLTVPPRSWFPPLPCAGC